MKLEKVYFPELQAYSYATKDLTKCIKRYYRIQVFDEYHIYDPWRIDIPSTFERIVRRSPVWWKNIKEPVRIYSLEPFGIFGFAYKLIY